jgi:hypothetical protein
MHSMKHNITKNLDQEENWNLYIEPLHWKYIEMSWQI